MVCRSLSKTFLKDLKYRTFVLLRDVGHFKDQFKEDILERDVMPWLMSAAQDQLDRLNGH